MLSIVYLNKILPSILRIRLIIPSIDFLPRENMEVFQKGEEWIEGDDGRSTLSHYKMILRKGDQYYYATTDRNITSHIIDNTTHLECFPITWQIWPPFPAHLTRAPDSIPPYGFLKQPNLLPFDDVDASAEVRHLLLSEAEVYEILKAHPHPNIAQYLGCRVENGKMVGICLVRYDMDLFQWIRERSRPFDPRILADGIEDGIEHLHSLGLVHCDINPANILMDDGHPIITDFDSCRREGERMGYKKGTKDWTMENSRFALRENDYYGLLMIREWLYENWLHGEWLVRKPKAWR